MNCPKCGVAVVKAEEDLDARTTYPNLHDCKDRPQIVVHFHGFCRPCATRVWGLIGKFIEEYRR